MSATIIVVGNIGSCEVQTSNAGNKYIRLSVASDYGSGENKKTTWYSVLLLGKMAENADTLAKYFRKGRLVQVTGRPQVQAFIKNDGAPGVENTIVAYQLPELLDRGSEPRNG